MTQVAYWVLVRDFELYLVDNEIPFGKASQFGIENRPFIEVGQYQQKPVLLVQADAQDNHREFVNLRTQLFREEPILNLLHRAVSLNHFLNTHRYCGKCATPFKMAENELALHCPSCHNRIYPTISPSIIVAVRRGRKILLANHLRHKGTIYTTLAGFVEAGETVEDAVHREVWEESKINIKNIRYFGSQPWAFPNSLMLGFLADYESGEIVLQEEEIFDAKWFDCDEPLPELPPEGTIALKLIQATLELCKQA
ncbi:MULTISPECIES: NAD(+) diphosphatase [Glaesserella]|uniref:NAD-capped RNA hydrolase NudC n=1 Tax=Glaesserella australis TaxID=2094024 RepID=A0A328BZX1_9PAST|nr:MULTISPECIES: NAD(+) diphosphatase [Glaesserella]AUI66193.1 NAD(+) diphosphatase [Glaesserella sp. 15-184]RAL19215.1 NAD(+) diphosphatase [Glaesserella australis]